MKRLICFYFAVLLPFQLIQLCAQSPEVRAAEQLCDKLDGSSSQWLVAQLEAIQPGCLDKPFNLPLAWDTIAHLQLGRHHWQLSDEQRTAIQNIWLGRNNGRRLATIASLMEIYFPLFRSTCSSAHLPSAFAYLPILTSGINAHYSSNDGRAGLWGLDYLSARKAKLQISLDIDERCGGDFTAKAVSSHLAELVHLHGDALKALLCYLYGAPQVVALDFQQFEQLPQAWQLEISFLLFTEQIFEQLRLENHQQAYFDIMSHYSPIRPKDTLALSALEVLMHENLSNFRGMNPTLKSERMIPGVLKVPYYISTKNAELWAYMEDSLLAWKPEMKRVPPPHTSSHTVKRGESLGSLAKKYKTTVRALQRENNLKGQTIRIGQRLTIPGHASPEVQGPPKPAKKEKNAPPQEDAGETTYIVKSGDSLWKIARKYKGVTEQDIQRWNKCGEQLRPGQKLIIKRS